MGSFLAGPVGSWVRVMLGFILAAALAVLASGGTLADLGDASWWQLTLSGAVGAVLPLVIAWVNPADPRFGKTAPSE